MVFHPVEEPVFQPGGLLTFQLPEKTQTGFIAGIDEGKELVQVQHIEGIGGYLTHGTVGVALPTIGFLDDQSQLSPSVAGVEIDNVHDTDDSPFFSFIYICIRSLVV